MLLHCKKPLQHLKAFGKFSKSPWLIQTYSDAPYKKSKLAPLQERKMIDRCRVWAKGGDGGNGCCSFRRSRHDRRGRPDGGNGGRGGDVILECSPTVWDFSSLQHHMNAKRGGHGASKNKIGSRGADKVALVPVGTVIHLVEGDIPVAVENNSPTTDLNPWDIPGALDDKQSEFAPELISTDASSVVESANVKKATLVQQNVSLPQSSPFCSKTGVPAEDSHVWEEGSGSELEGLDTDDGFLEEEWEEEVEEKEQVQYNLAELTIRGQRIIVAQGGIGGLGNVSSQKAYKNPKHGKPETQKQKDIDIDHEESDDDQHSSLVGLPGSEAVLLLELKSIADVGLVGMPNAGKSTLLGALSRAKPTVGHYAFTTLRPNLGNVNYDDFSVTVADIPGLIRGAHENRGLGHAFLRHIERTKVLAYVVDLAAALDGRKGIHPWTQLKDLLLELEFYRNGLSNRPSLVVANKIDEAGAEEVYEELKRRVCGVPIFPVCAILEEGIPELKEGLRMLVNVDRGKHVLIDHKVGETMLLNCLTNWIRG